MTNQKKKQWLKSYKALNLSIDQKLEELERLKSLACKVTQAMTGMPRGGNSGKENTYLKIIELEDAINGEIDKYIELRNEIETAILSVNDLKLQNVLRHRYINGMTWESIAVKMNYDYRWVLKLHGKALTELSH